MNYARYLGKYFKYKQGAQTYVCERVIVLGPMNSMNVACVHYVENIGNWGYISINNAVTV